MTAVRALLDEEDTEAFRVDLTAGHYRDACNLLLNRAVELRSLLSVLPDLAGTATTRVVRRGDRAWGESASRWIR
jgi:hypothetical protein